MTYITKPKFHHPALPKNALGYTHRDYEGSVSTLCAGCGHDSISGAIIEACFELDIAPDARVASGGDGEGGHWLLTELEQSEQARLEFILKNEIVFTLVNNYPVGSHFAAQQSR